MSYPRIPYPSIPYIHRISACALLHTRIDPYKYVVRTDTDRGIISIYWKESERDDLIGKFLLARETLSKKKGNRLLTYSCSATLSVYSREQCVDRLINWYHWHRSWVYDKEPPITLPTAMPTRPHVPQGAFGLPSPPNQQATVDLFAESDTSKHGDESESETEPFKQGDPLGDEASDSNTASVYLCARFWTPRVFAFTC